jgi:acetyltransferase-like isoleucine patch superfamily enzyme
VTLEDEVFVGHNVTFINDRYPRATNGDGGLQTGADWECIRTVVKRGASIGSGATLLRGITAGEYALHVDHLYAVRVKWRGAVAQMVFPVVAALL